MILSPGPGRNICHPAEMARSAAMPAVQHAPPELSSFVGRSGELAAVLAAAGRARLVTLVGPGGCGKTRLALRAARGRDGAVWVGLDAVASEPAGGVARRVADALGALVPAGDHAVAALAAAVRERAALLVLDNCEHLLAETAEVVAALLAAGPALTVLATSRAPLGVPGELVHRVPPMALGEALELFLTRAGLAGPDAAAAGRLVCDRVDRLPLALELAAGWAGTLGPAQIAAALVDPYAVLDGGPRTAPFRQQTLEGSMRWSHDLLTDEQRTLFRRLAPLRGPFTMDAVAGMSTMDGPWAAPPLRALRGLVDASLVQADLSGPTAGYRMLGVVRGYAGARLDEAGEAERARDRHLQVQLAAIERLAPLLDTDKDTWRAEVRPLEPDVLAAVEWGLSRPDPGPARRLAAATAWLWQLEGNGRAGLRLLRRAVELGRADRTPLQARVLAAEALVADTAEPGAASYTAADAARRLAEEVGDLATARLAGALAVIGELARDVDAARSTALQRHEEAHEAGDAFVADATAVFVGTIDVLRDEHAAAVGRLGPAAEGLLGRGDRGIGSTGLGHLALSHARTGRFDLAAELAGRAARAAEPLHDVHRVGFALGVLALVRGLQGRPDEADAALEPVRVLAGALDPAPFVPGWERTEAQLARWRDRPDEAVRWCRRELPDHGGPTPETALVLAAALREAGRPDEAAEVLDDLDRSGFPAALPRVRAGVLEERAHLAGPDHPDRALAHHHEALRIRARHGLAPECVDSLEALAVVGRPETVAVLLGAAAAARDALGYAARCGPDPGARWPDPLDPDLRAALDRGRAMDLDTAVELAGRARGPRGRPDSGWASLTPTEQSVVDRAVRGLSNPQIAAELFIGRGTVKTHLAHVYTKLGVRNRTELATAWSQR
jgi:predicted ATPase/DNA-binding CsgD family transcriptional regulator